MMPCKYCRKGRGKGLTPVGLMEQNGKRFRWRFRCEHCESEVFQSGFLLVHDEEWRAPPKSLPAGPAGPGADGGSGVDGAPYYRTNPRLFFLSPVRLLRHAEPADDVLQLGSRVDFPQRGDDLLLRVRALLHGSSECGGLAPDLDQLSGGRSLLLSLLSSLS